MQLWKLGNVNSKHLWDSRGLIFVGLFFLLLLWRFLFFGLFFLVLFFLLHNIETHIPRMYHTIRRNKGGYREETHQDLIYGTAVQVRTAVSICPIAARFNLGIYKKQSVFGWVRKDPEHQSGLLRPRASVRLTRTQRISQAY